MLYVATKHKNIIMYVRLVISYPPRKRALICSRVIAYNDGKIIIVQRKMEIFKLLEGFVKLDS